MATRHHREHAWSARHRQRLQREPARSEQAARDMTDIDESLLETFPASDPPSWTALARVGSPHRRTAM
jgi:hypothetical protein